MLPLLSLKYADLFNRRFFLLFFFRTLSLPVSTSVQVWKDKKSHVSHLFLPTRKHAMAQPHGVVCSHVDASFATCSRLDVAFTREKKQLLSTSCYSLAAESFVKWQVQIFKPNRKAQARVLHMTQCLCTVEQFQSIDTSLDIGLFFLFPRSLV